MDAMKYKYAFALLIGNNVKIINISIAYNDSCFAASRDNTNAINFINTNAEIIGKFLQKLLNNGYDFDIIVAAENLNSAEYVQDGNCNFGYRLYDKIKDDSKNILKGRTDAKYSHFLNAIEIPSVKSRIICVGAMGHTYDEDIKRTSYYYSDYSKVTESIL